jgi:hypothetical protein
MVIHVHNDFDFGSHNTSENVLTVEFDYGIVDSDNYIDIDEHVAEDILDDEDVLAYEELKLYDCKKNCTYAIALE